mmetsp:Transcript_54358/g.97141  ORF Transcript_54358/g.97141 Transcript_54358/m.97141 type:complete len:348 (-) Transcript_54358:2263-3306(-)
MVSGKRIVDVVRQSLQELLLSLLVWRQELVDGEMTLHGQPKFRNADVDVVHSCLSPSFGTVKLHELDAERVVSVEPLHGFELDGPRRLDEIREIGLEVFNRSHDLLSRRSKVHVNHIRRADQDARQGTEWRRHSVELANGEECKRADLKEQRSHFHLLEGLRDTAWSLLFLVSPGALRHLRRHGLSCRAFNGSFEVFLHQRHLLFRRCFTFCFRICCHNVSKLARLVCRKPSVEESHCSHDQEEASTGLTTGVRCQHKNTEQGCNAIEDVVVLLTVSGISKHSSEIAPVMQLQAVPCHVDLEVLCVAHERQDVLHLKVKRQLAHRTIWFLQNVAFLAKLSVREPHEC